MTSSIARYTILVAIALALPVTTAATTRDDVQECYLPLNDGNYWVYAQPNNLLDTITIKVIGSYRIGEHRAYLVENWCFCLGGPMASESIFRMFSTHTETCEINGEKVAQWYSWCDSQDNTVRIPEWGTDCLHGCEGTIFNTDEVGVPAGHFDRTKTVFYHAYACLDQMPLREIFAPGVGLITRIVWLDGVAQTWVLTEARVNGIVISMGGGKGGPSTSPELNQETTWGAVKSIFTE
jgi:hypothetical protein